MQASARTAGGVLGGAITFLAGLALYLPRIYPVLAPGGNHGELAAAGVCLGVAHPPGFPVLVHAIRLAQLVPFANLGWRSGLLAAGLAAACLTALFVWVRSFAGWSAGAAAAAALAIAGGLAGEALAIEVYGASLLVLLLVAGVLDRERFDPRRLAAAGLLAGLGLAGHPTLVFGLAGLLLLARPIRAALAPRVLSAAGLFGLLGLSAFLALPLRSAAGVPVDWGSPNRWPLFAAHLTALQFRGLMLSSPPAEMAWRAGLLGRHLATSLPWPVLVLAPLGLAGAARPYRRRLLAAGVGSLLLAVFAADYRIHDITAYLLPIEMFAALAAAAVVARLAAAGRRRGVAALALFGLGLAAAARLPDRSDRYLAFDVGCHLLARVPPGGLLISEGDLTTAAFAYLSVAEGMRPDVLLHDRLGNLLSASGPGMPGLAPGMTLGLRYAGRTLAAGFAPEEPERQSISDGLAYWRPARGGRRLPPRAAVDACALRGLDDLAGTGELERAMAVLVHLARLDRARVDPAVGDEIEHLERARRAAGNFGALRFAIARALGRAGEYGAALADLEAAALDLPFNAPVWNSLAWNRLQAGGDLDAALAEARRAAALDPTSAAAQHTLGSVLFQRGEIQMAAGSFERATTLDPASARYLQDFNLARQRLSSPRGEP